MRIKSGRTAVYRMYDAEDVLLYVGIASKIGTRWDQHAPTQPWWEAVHHQTVTWYDTRTEAESAELEAIHNERPVHNIAGNPAARWDRQAERAAPCRSELDRKFSAVNLEPIQARPHSGWIRAIREALGMSQTALARRLEITRGSVNKLEHAELRGGITISKLDEVAAALHCTVVYALVPDSTLEQTVLNQARATAAETFRYAARTMALSGRAVSDDYQREAIERAAQELARKGKVWDTWSGV